MAFWLSDAPLPLMSGANHMGWAFEGFVHGSTSDELQLDGCWMQLGPFMGHGVVDRRGSFLTFRPVGWKWCRCEHPCFRIRSKTAIALQVASSSCQAAEEISTLWTVEFVGSGTSRQSAIQQRFQGRQITLNTQP